ncbi:MAG TPA: alanine--glyoxylate aminotransferase family protein [Epsilonproteobacteria bacterium]|nr:alanine--glyoxylate aminotransferase family protein [Campylobacterota bacterium]
MLLFTPGPTPVLESVRQAMATPTLHHRTPEFESIFAQARGKMIDMFGMDECVFLASSGTGAMQACMLNLCHTKALTVKAGKFGERFGKIADALHIPKVELSYSWDTPASVEDIKQALISNLDIDAIFIQICESAGGLRHPVEEIAKVAKSINKDIMVIADGITAVGVEPIDTTHIDALIAGSQKAFMLPPGLAMIGLSSVAVDKIGGGRDFYFNLATEIKNQQKNTTAWTATTTLIAGLNAMLDEIEKSGGRQHLFSQTRKRAKATLGALKGLNLHIYPSSPALSMSTVIDDDAEAIRKLLKTKYGVNIAGGQDHLKGKIFRINQMGLIPVHESAWVVNAIELALDDLGRRDFDGTASKIFSEIYFEEN